MPLCGRQNAKHILLNFLVSFPRERNVQLTGQHSVHVAIDGWKFTQREKLLKRCDRARIPHATEKEESKRMMKTEKAWSESRLRRFNFSQFKESLSQVCSTLMSRT